MIIITDTEKKINKDILKKEQVMMNICIHVNKSYRKNIPM